MFDDETDEACPAEQAHCEMMERGSDALLAAIRHGRPAPDDARTRVIWSAKRGSPPPPKAERKRGIWPSWYRPPVKVRISTELLQSIAEDFDLTVGDLVGQSREGYVVDARAVVVAVLAGRGWSTPQIGRLLGGRDHSTIINIRDKFPIYAARNGRVDWSFERRRMGV